MEESALATPGTTGPAEPREGAVARQNAPVRGPAALEPTVARRGPRRRVDRPGNRRRVETGTGVELSSAPGAISRGAANVSAAHPRGQRARPPQRLLDWVSA